MSKFPHLCIISGAQLEKEGDSYFGRFAFLRYLEELGEHFDRVSFLTRVKSGRDRYSTKLKSGVAVEEISYRSGEANPLKLAARVFRDQGKLWKLLEGPTAVIVYYPCSWAIPLLPIIWLKSEVYLAYFGNDPEEFVVSAEGNTFPGTALRKTLYKGAQILSVMGADGLVARGRETYRQLKRYGKIVHKAQPIISITKEDLYHREDTCKGGTVKLLYVGGLYERKGLSYLLEALEGLVKREVQEVRFQLLIVGEGEQRSILEELVARRGLEERVDFAGYVDDKEELLAIYRKADVFVLPSRAAEGFPRVIDEAMAEGLPVVATEAGSISSELEDDEEALVVPPEDGWKIAEAIERLVEDGQLRRRLIRNGRRRVLGELEPSAAAQHAEIVLGLGS